MGYRGNSEFSSNHSNNPEAVCREQRQAARARRGEQVTGMDTTRFLGQHRTWPKAEMQRGGAGRGELGSGGCAQDDLGRGWPMGKPPACRL